jgi:hypothetical protein
VSVLLNMTVQGATAPTFATQTTFSTGTNPFSVAVGDFNGDGKPDLALANGKSNSVSVLLNMTVQGATVPSFSFQTTFATGSGPNSVAVGDFNGDGKPDLAIANGNSNSVSVLLNTTAQGATTPSFATQTTFATGREPNSVAVGDFNGDGKPELAITNYFDNSVSVLLNTTKQGASAPSFASQTTLSTGIGPFSVAVGDFNGDGSPELAIANYTVNNPLHGDRSLLGGGGGLQRRRLTRTRHRQLHCQQRVGAAEHDGAAGGRSELPPDHPVHGGRPRIGGGGGLQRRRQTRPRHRQRR